MKSFKFLDVNNIDHSLGAIKFTYAKFFLDLPLETGLKDWLKAKIEAEEAFDISSEDVKTLSLAVKRRLEEIETNPNFDPYKEELRKEKPQYGGNPIEYEGKTYYMYVKGGRFPLDEEFLKMRWFRMTLERQVDANAPISLYIKEYEQ